MSAASQTKIFGMRVGVDPKLIVGGLVMLSALLFWYNSRGGEESGRASTAAVENTGAPAFVRPITAKAGRRRTVAANDRGTLRIRAIDPTRGDVDPTLRLDLLSRLQAVEAPGHGRSLFEVGPAPQPATAIQVPHPKIVPQTPGPLPGGPGGRVGLPPLTVNIPLKFYGFAKPAAKGELNRGLFLEGDNVIVASEGELVDHKYLVVELTPTSARMEDVQVKQRQDLPIVPEAVQ